MNPSSLRPYVGPFLALSGLLATSTAIGADVTITTADPTIYTTSGLSAFATEGDDMVGMSVSVTYSDASIRTAIWAAGGAGAGSAVNADDFSLSLTGDTFTSTWTLANLRADDIGNSITEFTINARLGNTIFDYIASPETTTGSSSGAPFAFTGASIGVYTALVHYFDALQIGVAAPAGDLFLQMRVQLTPSIAGGSSMLFLQDTDNAAAQAIIEEVPEASTYAAGLALVGLTGYGFLRRRQAAK